MRSLFITAILFVISIDNAGFANGHKGMLTRFSKVLRQHKQDFTARTQDIIWRTGRRIERAKHWYYWYGTAISIGNLPLPRDAENDLPPLPSHSSLYKRYLGDYFAASLPDYILRSYNKDKDYRQLMPPSFKEKIAGELSLVGYSEFSAMRETSYLESSGVYDLHQLLVAKKGKRLSLVVIDGLWGDSYLGGFVAEKVVSILRESLATKTLQESLLALPDLLDAAVRSQVKGLKGTGDYDPSLPISEDAAAFIVGAEIVGNTLNVSHIGNANLLLIRNGKVLWQTTSHNAEYQMSSNPETSINPADESERQFKALELSEHMAAPLKEMLERTSITLQSGDRFVLASDSVWLVCSSDDIIAWTNGRSNGNATQHARNKIADRIAKLNKETNDKEYDNQFSLIVYDHDPNRLL